MEMRHTLAACFPLLLVIAALPIVDAQGVVGASETRVTDPEGDIRVVGPATNQSDPEGRYGHVDLREGWLGNESFDTLEFGARFRRLDPGTGGSEADFAFRFDIGAARYALGSAREIGNCGAGYGIVRLTPKGSYAACSATFAPKTDPVANTRQITVNRDILVNDTNFPFGPGITITNFHVTASTPVIPAQQFGTYARDRAPDAGVGTPYRSALGNVTSHGGLELFARDPIRISNGESTTLVYPVDINNTRDEASTVLLSISGEPSAWKIRAPSRLLVGAHETVKFPVILSMGFEHRHGELATFGLRAQNAHDQEGWSEMRLGVYWLDSPQPAGHHDKLWLHSGGRSTGYSGFPPTAFCSAARLWMNSIETEKPGAATEEEAGACTTTSTAGTGQTVQWVAPLQPDLAIGLDFDVDREGAFAVDLRSRTGADTATLVLDLLYCDPSQKPTRPVGLPCPGDWIVLTSAKSATRGMPAGVSTKFEVPFKIDARGDYLPFQRDANLGLVLKLTTDRPQTPPNYSSTEYAPTLLPKSALLVLPLIEYHDPIDQAFQNVGSLHLETLTAFEKPVNPGRTVVFSFHISNTGASAQNLRALLEGHNRDWARFVGDADFRLAPNGVRNLTLAVDVPDDAGPGERAELFLIVESADDPNVAAISRLRATVVDPEIQDVPNEQASGEGEENGIPNLSALSLVAALVLTAGLRRIQRVKP